MVSLELESCEVNVGCPITRRAESARGKPANCNKLLDDNGAPPIANATRVPQSGRRPPAAPIPRVRGCRPGCGISRVVQAQVPLGLVQQRGDADRTRLALIG